MEAYLSDSFLDRVRRAYQLALEAGGRARGRTWRKIDARRQDVHAALLAQNNSALRAIFGDPTTTDLYFGTDGPCRSLTGSGNGRPFLQFALESTHASFASYELDRVKDALTSLNGSSVVEIGPGVGYCASFAHRAGIDYTTIDLPLGIAAQACFLGRAVGPHNIWMEGDEAPLRGDQIKIFSNARLPDRQFDVALNVDSMTEMSLDAAVTYMTWLNRHARFLVSINHEINPFKMSDLAECCLFARRINRRPVPERGMYYFEETFLVNGAPRDKRTRLARLKAKTLIWSIGVPIRKRLPFIGYRYVSAAFGAKQSSSCN